MGEVQQKLWEMLNTFERVVQSEDLQEVTHWATQYIPELLKIALPHASLTFAPESPSQHRDYEMTEPGPSNRFSQFFSRWFFEL
jgi:hypothetical protein